jgi:hypothetical protein
VLLAVAAVGEGAVVPEPVHPALRDMADPGQPQEPATDERERRKELVAMWTDLHVAGVMVVFLVRATLAA